MEGREWGGKGWLAGWGEVHAVVGMDEGKSSAHELLSLEAVFRGVLGTASEAALVRDQELTRWCRHRESMLRPTRSLFLFLPLQLLQPADGARLAWGATLQVY